MTMVFRVKDTTILDAIKPDDKIYFIAEKIDDKLTITKIEVAK